MSINILIVDGNDQLSSDNYRNFGIATLYKEYSDVLNSISTTKLNIEIIHPAVNENFLPLNINLDNFHGIVWTGSTLNIYHNTPSVMRQIELAKLLITKKNKIFGSCWGLQVFSTVAGGTVNKNINGLEAVISKNIILNKAGLAHRMYSNKQKIFDAFCWHNDEVKFLPSNSTVLAYNNHSIVQALTFKVNKSEFWGVQYHPEFSPVWIAKLMQLRKKILLDNKIYTNENEFNKINQAILDISNNKQISSDININNSLIDRNIHYLELKNWLKYIESSI